MAASDRKDERLDAILTRTFARASDDLTPQCPDAAVLADWFERTLDDSEARNIESHLASCGRCQSITAAMARVEDSALEPRRISRNIWRVAVPAMAAAIAGVVIIRTGLWQPFGGNAQVARSGQVGTASEAKAPSPPESLALNQPVPEAAFSESSNEVAAAAPAASAPAVQQAPEAHRRMKVESPRRESASAAASAGGVATLGGLAARPAAQLMAPSQQVEIARNAPPGSSINPDVLQASLARVSSPDGKVAWLLGEQGLILRRDQTGQVIKQASGVSADLTNGAALSESVCWVVGRAGTILVTIDGGSTWQKVSSPTNSDLLRASATSPKDATVYGTRGETFSTSDGGNTWTGR